MQIKSIPMWTGTGNNYAYLVIDDDTRKALVIDPANPEEVIPTIKDEKIDLVGIVNTHHHSDHSHGNKKLLELLNLEHLPITGGVKCQAVTNTPADKSEFTLGNKVVFRALHTPCHTQDSICYYVTDGGPERAVFTGDTLFISGCGRFFEGNAEEMDTALNKVLASLPDDTKVYPGHEYTKSNVRFSLSVTQAQPVKDLAKLAEENAVTAGKSTIGEEKRHNPFMMLNDPQVQQATGETDPVQVMAKLRQMKNDFK